MDFAVFFSNEFGAGIGFLPEIDLAQAIETAHEQYPNSRLAVVPAKTIAGMDRHRLLAAWLDAGCIQPDHVDLNRRS